MIFWGKTSNTQVILIWSLFLGANNINLAGGFNPIEKYDFFMLPYPSAPMIKRVVGFFRAPCLNTEPHRVWLEQKGFVEKWTNLPSLVVSSRLKNISQNGSFPQGSNNKKLKPPPIVPRELRGDPRFHHQNASFFSIRGGSRPEPFFSAVWTPGLLVLRLWVVVVVVEQLKVQHGAPLVGVLRWLHCETAEKPCATWGGGCCCCWTVFDLSNGAPQMLSLHSQHLSPNVHGSHRNHRSWQPWRFYVGILARQKPVNLEGLCL